MTDSGATREPDVVPKVDPTQLPALARLATAIRLCSWPTCGAMSQKNKKWWYEVAKGNIYAEAVLCRSCRKADRDRRAEARRVHLEGLARKRGRTKT